MNKDQLTYARQRAEKTFQRRAAELLARFNTPARPLDRAGKLEALARGEFDVDPTVPEFKDWYRAIVFTAEVPAAYDEVAHKAALAELTKAYTDLTDELVLGDNQQALVLLRAFEAA